MEEALAVGVAVLRYVSSRRSSQEIGAQTAYRYRIVLLGFAQVLGMSFQMRKVNRQHLDRWFASRDKAGVSRSTLAHEYSVVRSFCRWAVDMNMMRKSPCDGVKGPRMPESSPRAMVTNDVSLTLDACPDARARAIVSVMVQCGLRCCEVSRLETADVSLTEQVMLVHGKGSKDRWVPLPDEAVEALTEYLLEFPPIAGRVFRSYHPPFQGVTPAHIGHIVRQAMSSAGVKRKARDGKSAHALRHTMAAQLVENNVDLELVRQILGHASLQTVSIYSKRLMATSRLSEALAGRTYRVRPTSPGEEIIGHLPPEIVPPTNVESALLPKDALDAAPTAPGTHPGFPARPGGLGALLPEAGTLAHSGE